MNFYRLKKDLSDLSCVYPVAVDDEFEHIVIKDFNLPPGYNWDFIPVLLELPKDYPESPLGVGESHVFVPMGLRFQGRIPGDYHKKRGPNEKWAWWCYEWIKWDPCKDNFITFFELLRAHMTDPD